MKISMNRKKCSAVVIAAGLISVFLFSVSPVADAAESMAVDARKKLMKTKIGAGMGQMKKGMKAGDTAQMLKGAEMIATAAVKIPAAFEKKEMMGKTRAKANIWEKKSDFDAIANSLAESAKAFAVAVKSGENMAISGALKSVGANCGKCHKMYRAKKKKK